jgi:NCAIR mutase (PurE)-related protein
MWSQDLRDLLGRVARGEMSADDAMARLRDLPFEDLDFARVDHHRDLRQGMPEAIYGPGKTVDQVVTIARRLARSAGSFLATRVDADQTAALTEAFPESVHHEAARCVVYVGGATRPRRSPGRVSVVTAGTADIPVAEEASITAEYLGHEVDRLYDVGVSGLHRVMAERAELARADAVIVVAGMEGALPSVVGGLVAAPVVAVPTSVGYGASFGGIAALLGMLSTCAQGVTVVNIDAGFSAACAVHRALAGAGRRAEAGDPAASPAAVEATEER